MDEQLRQLLIESRSRYLAEGFVLLGVFGSRARGDHRPDSDLDILYRLEDEFLDRYNGWGESLRLEEIKEELSLTLGLKVDLADRDALRKVGQRFILPETIYVA